MRRFSQHAGARYNEIGCLTISNRKVRGLTSVNPSLDPAAWVPEAFSPQALAGKNRRSPFTREHGIFARASSLEPVSLVAILKRDFIHSVQSNFHSRVQLWWSGRCRSVCVLRSKQCLQKLWADWLFRLFRFWPNSTGISVLLFCCARSDIPAN